MTQLESIKKSAEAARRWAERYQQKNKRFGFDADLGGLCAIATARVCHELEKKGFKPEAVVEDGDWMGHCYAVVNGYVVDVTATQFGSKRLYITPLESRKKFIKRATQKTFSSLAAFQSHLRKERWPEEQQPCFQRNPGLRTISRSS